VLQKVPLSVAFADETVMNRLKALVFAVDTRATNYIYYKGHTVAERSWLRHCATGRKVAGSYPDEVIGFFN
jgi:hypothetical protein